MNIGPQTWGSAALRQAPRLTLLVLCAPIFAGLFGAIWSILAQPSGDAVSAFVQLANWPGFGQAAALSIWVGLASGVVSLFITLLLTASLLNSQVFWWLQHLLSPLLAVPHAAAALGLGFMISPSGWIARLFSPWATGWQTPPDLQILNDPYGVSLILGLVCKEVPFLLLVTLSALAPAGALPRMAVAVSLGYGRVWGFVLTALPALYPHLRLPIYAVLSYAMTSVDMAMILGPSLPPTLAVQITNWMTDPSLSHRAVAAAGALVQLGLVLGVIILWHVAERVFKRAVFAASGAGHRLRALDPAFKALALVLGFVIAGLMVLGLISLSLWSISGLWTFPNALPSKLSLQNWTHSSQGLMQASMTTLIIAVFSTLISLTLVIVCLEAEVRFQPTRARLGLWLLYLPLLVPQIVFLPGLKVLLLSLGLNFSVFIVALSHVVFVLPYVFLSLSVPFRTWDNRHKLIAETMGASANAVFWRLRMPMLLAPVLTAIALGIAVSVGQYLPTLLIGGGRVETLTTEAVALSSGGNRRIIGSVTLLQMVLPWLCFGLAIALPRLIFANRRLLLNEGNR